MRVILISAVYPPEPVVSAQISNDLYNKMKSKGWVVKVLCPLPSRPKDFIFNNYYDNPDIKRISSFKSPNSKIITRSFESLSFGIKASIYLLKNRKDFDKIYVNSWPFFSQIIIGLTAFSIRKKRILHVMDIYPEALKLKNKLLEKVLIYFDSKILTLYNQSICIGESQVSYLSRTRNIPLESFTHINLWSSVSEFSLPTNRPLNNKLEVLYFGNVGPLANLNRILDGIYFYEKEVSFNLTIAGSGSALKNLKNKVKKYDLKNVCFKVVPAGDEEKVFLNADIAYLGQKPNTGNTSIPSKIILYMMARKVILADVDEGSLVQKLITQYDCGYWVNSNSSSSKLIDQIETISKEKSSVLKLKQQNAYNCYTDIFKKETNINKIIDLIENF